MINLSTSDALMVTVDDIKIKKICLGDNPIGQINIFDWGKFERKWVNSSGVTNINTQSVLSDWHQVNAGDMFRFDCPRAMEREYVFYDQNKAYLRRNHMIRDSIGFTDTVTVPSNAVYMRFGVYFTGVKNPDIKTIRPFLYKE